MSGELLNQAMHLLAARGAIFVGQNVEYDGNVMYRHLDGIPASQRLELPVAEELQMGLCTGLALQGHVPVSIYPRFDFLLLAANQLVNHLDKLALCSQDQWKPKVIIRTKVGARTPLDAGPQHTGDHTEAFRWMLEFVHVRRLIREAEILPAYQEALESEWSTLIVEALDAP